MNGGGENELKPKRSWSDLAPRFLSALVLIPVTLACLYAGGIWFALLVGGVFAGVYREWEMMISYQKPGPLGLSLAGIVGLVAVAYVVLGVGAALLLSAGGAVAAVLLPGTARIWRVGGIVYLALVVIALMAIRGTGTPGLFAGLFLGFAVWLTDTAAFFTGRQVGGAKLSPDISPSKTWSGALGGLAIGALGAFLVWMFTTDSPWWIGALFAVTLSLLGQLGDLAESAVKRYFRIKDSGDIIPGHGGLMDRLDSLTIAAITMFCIGFFHSQDMGAIASGFLYW